MSRRIGEVLSVKGPIITVEVDKHISDLHVRHAGKTYSVGQPGSYLTVGRGHDRHLVLVTMVYKSQWSGVAGQGEEGQVVESEIGLPRGSFPYLPARMELMDRTLISGILIGTISGQSFEVGVTQLPIVGDAVTLTPERDLEIALQPPKDKHTVSIGTFVDSSIDVHLNVDELFGKHTAIVGTTGCGKSYTVAKLLQMVIGEYPGANVVVFDLHGEYRNCFARANYVRADELSLPVWLHSFESLFALCADLSNQYNIHNQRWAFREGMFRLKQAHCRDVLKEKDLADNIDLDAPIPFSIDGLGNWLANQNRATTDYNDTRIITYTEDGKKSSAREDEFDWFGGEHDFQPTQRSTIKQGTFFGQRDRLVVRFNSRRRDPRYAFMFEYDAPQRGDLERIIREVTGFLEESAKPVTVFDLSYLPSETVGMVVATLSRILFQVHFLSERRKSAPSLVVYEEAHNYIARSGRGAYGDAREAGERIAKEGRKFAIGVIAVSQRPSELSETLLSQCNTFLCMRLTNTIDKRYVESLLPDSMSEMVDVLPVLPQGHVLAVGQATKMPVRIKVAPIVEKERRPNSDDPPFGAKWKKKIEDRENPDIPTVCDNWIRSKRPGTNGEGGAEADEKRVPHAEGAVRKKGRNEKKPGS
jgi:hypothetical protein